MPNTGIDTNLVPVYLAAGFDDFDCGKYTLPLDVSRKFENKLSKSGDTVTVPLAVSFATKDYIPGSTIDTEDISQQTVDVVLNKSKRVTFALTEKELSLTPYELQQNYGLPALEALLAQVNVDIISEMETAGGLTNIDLSGSIGASHIRASKKALDSKKVGEIGRKLILPSDWANDLLEDEEFKSKDKLGDQETVKKGLVTERYNFEIKANHAMTDRGFAFHPSGIAFAARVYNKPVTGVQSSVGNYKGIPVRILSKVDDNWNLKVQFDILYGSKIVKAGRIQQIVDGSSY